VQRMSLSNKTLLFVVLSIAAFVGLTLWVADGLLVSRLARIEREQTAAEVTDACALLRHCAKEYGEHAASWSDSDAMAQFLRDGNEAFLNSKVSLAALSDELRADVLVIAREEGVPVYATQVNEAGNALEPCAPDFLEQLTPRGLMRPGGPFTGMLALQDRTYIVSSRPIHTASGADGPVRGRLVTAQEIDQGWLQNAREFCSFQMQLTRSSDEPSGAEERAARETLHKGAGNFVAESSAQQISGYGLLPDLYGQPALVLHVTRERALHQAASAIFGGVLWTLVCGGIVLSLLAYWATRRVVLEPVQRLLACTRRLWAGERSHVVFKSGDELEALARDINRMTDAVFECEEALQNAMRAPAGEPPAALPTIPLQNVRR